MSITFKDIFVLSNISSSNALYVHYHFPEMLNRYDSNFVEFRLAPTLQQFTEVEKYLEDFHNANNQNHVKFVFPQDEPIPPLVKEYLANTGYMIGVLELYSINPANYATKARREDVEVSFVNNATLSDYLLLQWDDSLAYGESFAVNKQRLLKTDYLTGRKKQIIAYVNGMAVGSTDIIVREKTVEIDGFFVLENMQRQGIGGEIQRFVMDNFQDKTVILVADGEDTPREMYGKQGYTLNGIQYNATKVKG